MEVVCSFRIEGQSNSLHCHPQDQSMNLNPRENIKVFVDWGYTRVVVLNIFGIIIASFLVFKNVY